MNKHLPLQSGRLIVWRKALMRTLLFQLLLLTAIAQSSSAPALVAGVEAIGMTVSDVDRSVEFFQQILSFEKVSDIEVTGTEYEHLQSVFGVRMRIGRMRLGEEFIELTEYLAPKGRLIPTDARSNDRSFQHIAIIVSDMDKAYQLQFHPVTSDYTLTQADLLSEEYLLDGILDEFYSCPACGKTAVLNEAMFMQQAMNAYGWRLRWSCFEPFFSPQRRRDNAATRGGAEEKRKSSFRFSLRNSAQPLRLCGEKAFEVIQ